MPTTDTINLACELIRRPSVTPNDAGCQALIRERLEALDFHCQTLWFGEGDEAVENLWAIHGESGPIVCFAGHTDVVPPGNLSDWDRPPFEPTIEDGFLYGRGSADMKSSIAAMITATENYIRDNPKHPGRIAFLVTADEEGVAVNGTVKVVEWLIEKNIFLDWCVVGEPSSTSHVGDVIKNGRRGSLGAQLKVYGHQGHVAYPHLADNPIHRIAPALAELTQTHWDHGNAFFPATTFQISNIQAGTGATNVIPADVNVLFNFRFSTEVTSQALQQKTEAILKKYELNFDIVWSLNGLPFLTPEGKLLQATQQAIEAITGNKAETSTAGGTSDGRFIARTGTQVIELGPVNATIHQINERVSLNDITSLHDIYCKLLNGLLNNA